MSLSVFVGGAGLAAAATTASGASNVGAQLTAIPTAAGDPVNWYTCGDESGSPLTDGTDTDTYVVHETDVGTTVCAVDESDHSESQPIGPITDPNKTPPVISGNAQEGQTLSVSSDGTWTDEPTASIDYQWCHVDGNGCTPILDATGSSYQLQASDLGQDVEVQETPVYSNGTATGAMVQSAAGDTVGSSVPVVTAAPTITGTTRQGDTLSAVVGSWTNGPTGYSFQWLQCTIGCTAIPAATGSTYRLSDADVGTSLEVDVTASNQWGSSETATSSRTAIVSATTSTSVAASVSSARVDQSVRLEAFVTSSADTADPDGSVTFFDDGTPIPGCVAVPASGATQGVAVSCSTTLGAGSRSLTAAFSPNAGAPLAGSSSAGETIQVAADRTKVTLDVPGRALWRQRITYTASVSPSGDLTGPLAPGGIVRFLEGGKSIRGCARVRVDDGGATCTVRYRRTGRERISARYGGDSNFRGAASSSQTVEILRVLPRLTVTATMQWTFHYTPTYTRILALALHGLVAHAQVTVRCSGRGCPFRARVRALSLHRPTLDLESSFRGRRLPVPTTVIVEVTRARYVGKYYRFTIRARRQPSVLIDCLAPGSKRPGVGCRRP